MTVLYSATHAAIGRHWIDCQDALAGDGDAVRRLMTRARGSADPVQQRLASAAQRHIAVVANRQLEVDAT